MKKNVKLGLMAGLLITPAIVAQAGEVQASETPAPFSTVAALTAEELLNSFKAAHEESSAQTIAVERNKYNTMSEAEKALLTEPLLSLINAKITYLESCAELTKNPDALKNAIGKLTTSNKNLIAETNAAQAMYDQLKNDLTAASGVLGSAAALAGNPATDFLSTLKYYGGDGPENFIKKFVAEDSLKKLEDNKDIVVKLEEFIKEAITPVQAAEQSQPVVKDSYAAAVENARDMFKEIEIADTAFKNILKIQIVENETGIEQFIKNAEANIAKAKSVEDKITDIKQNPPTGTTFNTKVTAILSEYDKLNEFQQALVPNYGDMESYKKTLQVVNDITQLAKYAANSEEFRNNLPTVETTYNGLGTDEKTLVTNADKLLEMRAAHDKAIAIEAQISAISAENADTTVSAARKAYNELTSAERRYVLADSAALLTAWEKSSSTAANVIKQIDAIQTSVLANIDDPALADTKKLSTTTSFVTKVRTAESSYAKIKAKDGDPDTKEQKLITNRSRLEMLTPIANIADKVAKLKVTSENYITDLAEAETALNNWPDSTAIPSEDQANIVKLKNFLMSYLKAQQDEQKVAADLDSKILALKTAAPVDLQKNNDARKTYDALSSNGKRLVKNIKILTDLEREYKPALDAIMAIDAIDVKAADFARKATTAETSFNKLTASMKETVYNEAKLKELLPIAKLMLAIDAIRPTANDFKTKLSEAQANFDQILDGFTAPADPATDLDIIKKTLQESYGKKLTGFQGAVTEASGIERRIDALATKSGEVFMTELAEVSAAYKKLDSATKRSVGNAKLLTELERDYKASLRVIEQIDKLPVNTDRSYASKVSGAQKAYERLTTKQKNDVYNYGAKLGSVLKAANLIDRIEKLRVGSKTYEADVAAIRAEYSNLSQTEKDLVHNITKLATAELGVSNAKEVIALIDAAIPTAENYIQKLIDARNSYDSLSSSDKRLVTNYKDLTNRERAVKPVLKLDTDILALDPSNVKTFISKYNAADKAYEKLSMSERALLVNTEKFFGDYTTIFKVVNAINSIKPSSKTFVEDTQTARALYNALPANLAAQVANYSTLQEHELNVEGGAKVDAMIRALNSAPPNEFIAKIKEAREAFKSLSSANKKAVTLESELKEQEKYIKPIEAAIKAIDGLSNPRNDLSRQFNTVNTALKKLDDRQKQYVTNMDQYSNLSNVIHVYTLIANLKPNDKYYQGNLEAAKLAYDKLSEEEKLKVTNYYKLQQAVLDVTEVQKVMTIIASLNSSSSNFEVDVENALAAYKALPSASKRQVLNYSALQQAERDVKAAQRVIKQIDDLDPSLRTYASRAKSAKTAYERLTIDQKSLVKNYNKLQAAIFELGL
ncbi:hypothetical protein ACTHOQ_16095 [Solibacillus silvestris]|uniref:hypothetical protein n=1 Tax=Solibacillus silvestris TaxID=76853 RepID=UPI003F7E1D82